MAYALDRPHGSLAAGAVVIAAGVYELTPVKRHSASAAVRTPIPGWATGCAVSARHRADGDAGGAGRDQPFWMAVVAVVCCAQKLLPAKAAIDIPLALAIVGLGLVIVYAPSLVPG